MGSLYVQQLDSERSHAAECGKVPKKPPVTKSVLCEKERRHETDNFQQGFD
jgi:hypothetical protein